MKKSIKIILCVGGALIALITVIMLCFFYLKNYKKTTCSTSSSPDGKYELILQEIGEPDWPFGSASGRLILMEGKNEVSQTDFELHNDGGKISGSSWKVTWFETYVEVILSGEEQEDKPVILYFNGTADIQHMVDTNNNDVAGSEFDESKAQIDKSDETKVQTDEMKATESWTINHSDGTLSFLLDDNNGWRLVIADAAAGSRFYEMEMTVDGGTTWNCMNEAPFGDQYGVAQGLIFFNENFGFAGLTRASQSYSALYITYDGGASFEKIKLPMSEATDLPESGKEYGFTIEDYDYLNMPEKNGDVLTITVTTDAEEYDGIIFQSLDDGVTWEYAGITQKIN